MTREVAGEGAGEGARSSLPPEHLRASRASNDFYNSIADLLLCCGFFSLTYLPTTNATDALDGSTPLDWIEYGEKLMRR